MSATYRSYPGRDDHGSWTNYQILIDGKHFYTVEEEHIAKQICEWANAGGGQ